MRNSYQLSNGITVVLDKMDSIRSVSIGVWVRVGSAYETEADNGISHMLEHMFFKGTKYRTGRRIADDMARIGGNMNACTSKECTAFHATTIDKYLKDTLDLLSDMLTNSVFREEELEKEKEVVLDEIDMYEDSAEDLVHEKLQQEVWKSSSLGYLISGKKETVETFTIAQLKTFKDRFYTGNRMVIAISGNFQSEEALKWLEYYFGSVPLGETEVTHQQSIYNKSIFSKKMDIEQIHMNLAFKCIDLLSEQRYVLTLTNAILGGNDNSRLFQRIREELGMTYSIYSYGSSFLRGGLFHIDVVLNPSKQLPVYKTIFDVLEKLKCDGVTEQELEMAKEQFNIEMLIDAESTKNRMNQYGRQMLYRRKLEEPEVIMAHINAVTREEIREFAEVFFTEETSSIALVGNI